jgi:hypothetical protein
MLSSPCPRSRTYKEGNVESVVNEIEVLNHALDTRIADIDAVQEGHHVNDEEDGVDDQIELPDKPALSLGINGLIIESCHCVVRLGRAGFGGRREGLLSRLCDDLLLVEHGHCRNDSIQGTQGQEYRTNPRRKNQSDKEEKWNV